MSPSPSPAPASSTDGARGRKSILFCQDCGHANPVDGDWRVQTVGGHQRTRCPECRSVIDDRRIADRSDAEAPDAPMPVQWCVDTWSHYWSAWTAFLADTPPVAESDC